MGSAAAAAVWILCRCCHVALLLLWNTYLAAAGAFILLLLWNRSAAGASLSCCNLVLRCWDGALLLLDSSSCCRTWVLLLEHSSSCWILLADSQILLESCCLSIVSWILLAHRT